MGAAVAYPKNTKQLLVNFEDASNNIIGAILDSKGTYKDHNFDIVVQRNPKVLESIV